MQYDSICYADIETTAIPASGVLDVETIHCMAVKSGDSPTLCYTSRFLPLSNYGGTLQNGLDTINKHSFVVFHNYTFDLVVLENLLGPVTAHPLDTMLLAKLIYTKDQLMEIDYGVPDFPRDKLGSFSLDGFGRRMYLHKGSHSDWSRLSVAMADYCTQDVEVTYALFQTLLGDPHFPSQSIIDLEHEVAYLIAQQVHYGFHFDQESARKLMSSLMYEQLSIELRLQKIFRPMLLRKAPDVTPTKPRRTKQYILDESYVSLSATYYHPHQYQTLKNGKVRFKKYAWFTAPHRIVYTHYSGGDYTPIELVKFSPGSRHKIRHWLSVMYDFSFATFTEKGNPKINEDELEFLGNHGKDLMKYLKVVKDLSEVRGVLEKIGEDSAIHGRVDTIGAATHRATHSSPNVAQTSQAKEFRQLYTAPPGMVLVGADLANIEVRVLAHYLYPYDNGKYAEAVLSKDMHWYHAGIAGFIEPDIEYNEHDSTHKKARNKSKGFFFGYLYGQGDTIRGHTLWSDDCLPDYTPEEYSSAQERVQGRCIEMNDLILFPLKKDEYVEYNELLILKTIYGKRIADIFLDRMTGIRELIANCAEQSKTTGYVKAIDGRYLYSRSPHSALNLLLQGSAGVIAKQWMVNYHRLAADRSLTIGTDYWQSAYIHDEYQCPCIPSKAELLGDCLVDGAFQVTSDFNMNLPIKADYIIGQTWADTH